MSVFDAASLHAGIAQAMAAADVDPTHTNAFILVGTINGGISGVYSHKINDVWQIGALFGVAKGEQPSVGFEVKATWP